MSAKRVYLTKQTARWGWPVDWPQENVTSRHVPGTFHWAFSTLVSEIRPIINPIAIHLSPAPEEAIPARYWRRGSRRRRHVFAQLDDKGLFMQRRGDGRFAPLWRRHRLGREWVPPERLPTGGPSWEALAGAGVVVQHHAEEAALGWVASTPAGQTDLHPSPEAALVAALGVVWDELREGAAQHRPGGHNMKFTTLFERASAVSKPWPVVYRVERFIGVVWLGWMIGAGWLTSE